MDRSDLFARYDEELRTDDYADVDASPNGLQVGTDEGTVDHVAFAVDAAVSTIDRAVAVGADALVTHHGLVWGGIDRVTGREFDRMAPLVRNDVSLYVSHLPLDGHQTLGNAAGVADVLGLAEDGREPFGSLGPEHIGQRGHPAEPTSVYDLTAALDDELDTAGRGVRLIDAGPEMVEDIAVVTGSGVDWLDEAIDVGADVLVTGEGKQKVFHEAQEAGINVVLAGHYATETFGVQALQAQADEWGLETTYIDEPTGL
ncbi:dinuclear metal center protein, YbgI/SA1388 family [Halogranum rubrum]|uniref:Dinuclear metal center protein, YbgI/SA1388 family n=1 Tax=Halogranum rubrum TaxID=553466 RepID=A0A1I4C951_9EURY|nr:Nif3-like dinuclear metal center hexameric protein [Halogranum rubrum]SFK77642.1 dinuclear metal center protein, YbgI/SA1388 family [Halogranum rubrum]